MTASSRGGGIGGRSAIPSAPPVVALAGKGLCDVRASPCRDLVILGDGFVSHESFQCSFEVYQVGGVVKVDYPQTLGVISKIQP